MYVRTITAISTGCIRQAISMHEEYWSRHFNFVRSQSHYFFELRSTPRVLSSANLRASDQPRLPLHVKRKGDYKAFYTILKRNGFYVQGVGELDAQTTSTSHNSFIGILIVFQKRRGESKNLYSQYSVTERTRLDIYSFHFSRIILKMMACTLAH